MGSQRELVMVAISDAAAVCGQSVPRSLRDSCLVAVPLSMVETSDRSKAQMALVAEGATVAPSTVLTP